MPRPGWLGSQPEFGGFQLQDFTLRPAVELKTDGLGLRAGPQEIPSPFWSRCVNLFRIMQPNQTDIATEKDIKTLVDSFYDKVNADPLLSPIFNGIAKVEWEHHLPTMYAF